MATSSTIPAAKAALVSLIGSALSGVQVKYGRPADNQLARECVWIGDVSGAQRIPVIAAGRKRREETYQIDVVCAVLRPRGEVSDAEARAFVLMTEVEDVVADDSTLGLATATGFFEATTEGPIETEAAQTLEGPACVVRFTVACKARLV